MKEKVVNYRFIFKADEVRNRSQERSHYVLIRILQMFYEIGNYVATLANTSDHLKWKLSV